MIGAAIFSMRCRTTLFFSLLAWCICPFRALANPTGGTVTQGSASIGSSGSQLTVTQTSPFAAINWSSFNIGAGETTTFVQPSSTSVAWNQINDANPSQILGNLNANGYVVLQNQNGFVVGGQATLSTHGLILTTASSPSLNLSSGAWEFDAPPPSAKIINYGRINMAGGGSAFLIANDIENDGTISAPGGNIGLYAGEKVLVSASPDGRGLSAEVTLPQGSVNNQGQLIADGGMIAAQAQTVNQNGLVQANSVQNVNGTIELVASDSVSLGANSTISAQGDSTGVSSGGSVMIKSSGTFSDQAGSTINISGGTQAGNGGQVEISAPQMGLIESTIIGGAASGYTGGSLTIDPTDITVDDAYASMLNSEISGGLSVINLQADDTIQISTLWTLPDLTMSGTLNLTAGNNIIFGDSTGTSTSISAGNDFTVNLTAGASFVPTAGQPTPASGSDGIYIYDGSFLQAKNGNLNLTAANEVQVGWEGFNQGSGIVNPGDSWITTTGGGNITVSTQYGDVNTGSDVNGYDFGQRAAPYYKVDSNLGGISTAAGGNVTITAGGDVISYLPLATDYLDARFDGGTGAFGPEAGNVTITAGGSVYGNYVLANGVGAVTAGQNAGAPVSDLPSAPGDGFALSLISGNWNVYAPHGSIYIQDVHNPNGVFGEKNANSSPGNYAGYHYFDYSPSASVLLDAENSVEITGFDDPVNAPSLSGGLLPMLFPPLLTVDAGAGGFILDSTVILFPSPDQGLDITTLNGGNFGIPNSDNPYDTPAVTLEMSDSSSKQWINPESFTTSDNAATLPTLDNTAPVDISVSGSVNAVDLYTTKATDITVGGDMINSGLLGENRLSSDVTSINVAGQIFNSPVDSFVQLTSPITSANPSEPTAWDSVFYLALTPAGVAAVANLNVNDLPVGTSLAEYLNENGYLLFPNTGGTYNSQVGQNPGFVYDSNAQILGFQGQMSSVLSPSQIAALKNGSFTVLVADASGNPLVINGQLETTTYNFSAAPVISTLDTESATASYNVTVTGIGYQIDGPGQLNVTASSINLGNSEGIASLGFYQNPQLESLLPKPAEGGASVTVDVTGDLTMITSFIDSQDGGNVSVNVGGNINLSEGTDGQYFNFQNDFPYGIYTSGHSGVSVTAVGNINVGNARIATFNGGNVFVESYNGSVDAGSGANEILNIQGVAVDPATGLPYSVEYGDYTDASTVLTDPPPYGSGILAEMVTPKYQSDGISEPGNITVLTPNGNIVSTVGGISQFALDATILGPSVTLTAGINGVTPPNDPDAGNILLGAGSVVGGEVNVYGTGKVQGHFVSQQNLNITGLSFTGSVLSDRTANVSASEAGGPSVIVGIGAVVANGLGSSATLLGQNVSANGGAAQSTLGSSVNASTASQASAAESVDQAQQQVASTDNESDDLKKKKRPLLQHIKRVTVILPKST